MDSLKKQEMVIQKDTIRFLRKQYGKVAYKKTVFDGFAPNYYVTKGRTKKWAFFFRNPPTLPKFNLKEIGIALNNGIGVYIVIYGHEYTLLLDSFLTKCEKLGIGVLHYSKLKKNFSVLHPSIIDYPSQDKIEEGLTKIFVSSKLWFPEREAVRKKIISLGYQQICVERLKKIYPPAKECKKRIDECDFFIGLINFYYRPMVDIEVRYALKKKHKRCLIYVNADSFINTDLSGTGQDKAKKLKDLIAYVRKFKTHEKFSTENQLSKLVKTQLPKLISEHTKED